MSDVRDQLGKRNWAFQNIDNLMQIFPCKSVEKTEYKKRKEKRMKWHNVQYDDYGWHCCVVILKAAKRADSKSFHYNRKSIIFFFHLYVYEMIDV